MAGDGPLIDVGPLHRFVYRVAVVEDEGDALSVPLVGADGDMLTVTEHHDVPGLPLGRVVKAIGQHLGMAAEEGVQVHHAAEVDVGVWVGVGIRLGASGDVRVHQFLQLIASSAEALPNHVGTDTQSVVGIAAGVVFAGVVGLGVKIGADAGHHVGVILHPVAVTVVGTGDNRDAQLLGGVIGTRAEAPPQQSGDRSRQQQHQQAFPAGRFGPAAAGSGTAVRAVRTPAIRRGRQIIGIVLCVHRSFSVYIMYVYCVEKI